MKNPSPEQRKEVKKQIMSNFDGWVLIDIIELLQELMTENRIKARYAAYKSNKTIQEIMNDTTKEK